MPTYGRYETVKELSRGAHTLAWSARSAGGGKVRFAVREFRPFSALGADEQLQRQIDRFLDGVRVQKQVAGAGGRHWGPVHDLGAEGQRAYYVTGLYSRTAERLILTRARLADWTLGKLVVSVVRGLKELRDLCGRAHGNLVPEKVLLRGSALSQADVFLVEPAPGEDLADEKSSTADLRAVGMLIFRLVTHRPFRSGAVPGGAEWQRLGNKGEDWWRLCCRLLTPTAAAPMPDLDELEQEVLRLQAAKPLLTGRRVAVLGLVAVLLAGAAAALWCVPGIRAKLFPRGPGNGREGPAAFDLGKWQALCKAGWFRSLQAAMKDERCQRWSKDPYLKQAVVDVLAKARADGIEFHPGEIADAKGVSISYLADNPPDGAKRPDAVRKTSRAVEAIEEVDQALVPDKWPALAELAAGAEELQKRGWAGPGQYLAGLVSEAGTSLKAVARVDRVLADQPLVDAVEKAWQAVLSSTEAIEASGSRVLGTFGRYVAAETRSGPDRCGREDVENLRRSLEAIEANAAELRAFLAGDWKTKVARQALIADEQPVSDPTWQVYVRWLGKARGYYYLTADPRGPRKSWDEKVRGIEGKLSGKLKTLDPQSADSFAPRLKEVAARLDEAYECPLIARNKSVLADQAAKLAAILDKLDQSVETAIVVATGDPEEWLAATKDRREITSSASINAEWRQRRDGLLRDATAESLKSAPAAYTALRSKVEAVEGFLRKIVDAERLPEGLDRSAALPASVSAASLDVKCRQRREKAVAAVLQAAEWAGAVPKHKDPADLPGWDRVVDPYRQWLNDVKDLMAGFKIVEDALASCCLPQDVPAGRDRTLGELYKQQLAKPAYVEFHAELAPLTTRLERLQEIEQAANKAELVAAIKSAKPTEPEVVLAAWRRLGEVDWPAGAAELNEERQLRDRFAAVAGDVRDEARKKQFMDQLAQEGPRRYVRCLGKLTEPADIESAIRLMDRFDVKSADLLPVVGGLADKGQVQAVIRGAGSGAAELTLAAWSRLGKFADWPTGMAELEQERVFREKLATAADSAADADLKGRIHASLAEEGPRRFRVCFARLTAAADIEAAIGMMDRSAVKADQLDPLGRLRVALHAFRQRVESTTDAKELEAEAEAFLAAVRKLPAAFLAQPDPAAFVAELDKLKAKDTEADVSKAGPAVAGWALASAKDAPVAKYTRGGLALEFVRLQPEGASARPFYLAKTELSLAAFNEAVRADSRVADIRKALSGEYEEPAGPRLWEWDRAGTALKARPQWVKGEVDIQDGQEYPRDLTPPAPSVDCPMQRMPPAVAVLAAGLLGCRLPTSAEWSLAYETYAKGGRDAKPNLRDNTWARQKKHVVGLAGVLSQAVLWPDGGAFWPKGAERFTAECAEPATTANDGVLWFSPVASGGGTFCHLVGNVAEFVYDVPKDLEVLGRDAAISAVEAALSRGERHLGVIGGSALSPPQVPIDKVGPVDLASASAGFSDVGVRLAFWAPSLPLRMRLDRFLRKWGYLKGP